MTEPARRLTRWVLTGPTGAGKSRAAAILAELGAEIIDADAEGHAVLREPEIVAAIARSFGPETVTDGVVDRAALGRRVFDDPAALARLNALVHPRLGARLAARLDALERAATEPGLAVVEAAVYFLLPPFGPVDLVIVVDAPPELRAARLVAAGRLAPDAAAARIAAQAYLAEGFARADVVLDNAGDEPALRRALIELHCTHAGGDAPGG